MASVGNNVFNDQMVSNGPTAIMTIISASDPSTTIISFISTPVSVSEGSLVGPRHVTAYYGYGGLTKALSVAAAHASWSVKV